MAPQPRLAVKEDALDKSDLPDLLTPLPLLDESIGEDIEALGPIRVIRNRPHVIDRTPYGYVDTLRNWRGARPVRTEVNNHPEVSEENDSQHYRSYASLTRRDAPESEDDSDTDEDENDIEKMDKKAEEAEKLAREPFFKRPYEDEDEGGAIPTEIDICRLMFGYHLPQAGTPRSDTETEFERDHRRVNNFYATLRSYMAETERRLKIKKERNDPRPSMVFLRDFKE